MGKNVGIDKGTFLRILGERKLGTGTVASAVGAHNDDIQRLLYNGYGEAGLVKKLADLLGDAFVDSEEAAADPEVEPTVISTEEADPGPELEFMAGGTSAGPDWPETVTSDPPEDSLGSDDSSTAPFSLDGLSVAAVLEAIEDGSVTSAEAIAYEKGQEYPRVTLLNALEK